MTGHYQKLGIQFRYPENWQVTDEETKSWPRTVSVQSPGGGFWSLMVYQDADPAELTKQVKVTMRGEYEDLEASEVEERFGEFVASGYDMDFYCLDFVVTARTLGVRAASQSYLLMWQAEDREFQELEAVFRAITTSLFSHVSQTIGDTAPQPHSPG